MTIITLEDAKQYLRVDSMDENALIGSLLDSSGRLCRDVARLSDSQWADVDSNKQSSDLYTDEELLSVREVVKTAVLYTLAYLFEHRDEADHHALILTLRALLFAVREGVL